MKNSRSTTNILLVNPWIYDFAAYDLWIKPLGLLYVGAALRRNGYRLQLVDCLDRNHPEMIAMENTGDHRSDGRGNFHRHIIEKPEVLSWVPRHFARYGYTEEVFRQELKAKESPDAILVTSMMTYWYKGVESVIKFLKELYPNVPVLLGGIYATLYPEHADKIEGLSAVIQGYGEESAVRWLDDYFNIQEPYIPVDPESDPEIPWDLYPELSALIVLTARGCPYRCTFCATHELNPKFYQRNPNSVIREIEKNIERFGIRDIVFYDDALFINKRKHIEVILDHIIQENLDVRIHTPNGLFARMIDERLAEKMVASGFRTIRLSFETSNEGRRKDMSNKVSNASFIQAVKNLERAGFPSEDIGVYTMMGLPDQTRSEVESSIEFVHRSGTQIRLASFSPIPGTVDFQRAVDQGLDPGTDPLLLNNTVYPLRNSPMTYDDFSELRQYAKDLNRQLTAVTT